VFISYARADGERAERLRVALGEAGFDAYLDLHDIKPGEPWQERLAALITNAEKIVYLISPDSVASEVCAWEIDEAEAQSKSVLPVVIRETEAQTVPGRLRRLNFIFMRDAREWDDGCAALVVALSTDLAWEREKTRINELAALWQAKGRPFHRLVFSKAGIEEMERWRDRHPASAPPPTETQLAFIAASRRAHGRRQMIGTGIAAGVAVFFGALAFFSYDLSIKARLSDVVATLRSGDIEGANAKYRDLAAAPLAGLWAESSAARETATEMLDTAVVLSVPPTETFVETTGAQGERPRLSDAPGTVACTPDNGTCVAYYFTDARATAKTFYVLGDPGEKISAGPALSAMPFDEPDDRNDFFRPPVSKNAFAISDDGALIAVTQDRIVRFWYRDDIVAGNVQPYRTLTLGFLADTIGFDPNGRALAVTGSDADGTPQARIVSVAPRLLLGGPVAPDDPAGSKKEAKADASPTTTVPIRYDAPARTLDVTGLTNVPMSAPLAVPAALRDLIVGANRAGDGTITAVAPRLLALPVGDAECRASGAEEPSDDLLVLHIGEDGKSIAKGWLIVCGPTQRGWPEVFADLAVAESLPADKPRRFVSALNAAGIYELGEDGQPLALFALCETTRKIDPHIDTAEGSVLATVRFAPAPHCQMASRMIWHGTHDLLSFYAASYNSPSGDRSAHYLDPTAISAGRFESPAKEYFDEVINMWASPSGDLLATYKDTTGIELFDVATRRVLTVPKSISQLNFDAAGIVVKVGDTRLRLAVPEVTGSAFGALDNLLKRNSYALRPASRERQTAYRLSRLDSALQLDDRTPETIAAARGRIDDEAAKVLAIAPDKAAAVTMKRMDFEVAAGEAMLRLRPPDIAAARTHFEAAIALQPDWTARLQANWAGKLLDAAERLYPGGESALGTLRTAPETTPLMETLVSEATTVLGSKGDPDQRGRAEYWRAHLALHADRFDEAIAAFAAAAELQQKGAAAWLWNTHMRKASQQTDPAAALDVAFGTYLDFEPRFRDDLWKGAFLLQLANPANALSELYLAGRTEPPPAAENDCDRLVRFTFDPTGAGPAVNFADIDSDAAIAACSETIDSAKTDGERARFLYQRGRARLSRASSTGSKAAKALIGEQARGDLQRAAAIGYPVADIALGQLLSGNLLEKNDFPAAAIATARGFNGIVRCCARQALSGPDVTNMIRPDVRKALLDWSDALNDADETRRASIDSAPDWMLPPCTTETCKAPRINGFRTLQSLFPPAPDWTKQPL